MKFYQYLDSQLSIIECDNKSFVAKLNVYNDIFKNVDEITFSRWRNGRATPALKKQLLINKKLGNSVEYFINNITLPKSSKTFADKLKRIFKKDYSYNAIDYFSSRNNAIELSSNHDRKIEEIIYNFYSLFLVYQDNIKLLDILKSSDTKFLYVKSPIPSVPSSHTAITHFRKALHTEITVFEEGAYFIHISYFRTSIDFRFLVAYLLVHIYRDIDLNSNIYFLARNKYFIDIYAEHNSTLIFSQKNSDSGFDAYGLYKVKLIDLLSNSNVAQDCQVVEQAILDSNFSDILL
ncbi:hypothetical protein NI382_20470 [Vibrio parahaemolyticus]|nr:hypothetical protein NI382_20470 [Vibrio parahaemolyticus]